MFWWSQSAGTNITWISVSNPYDSLSQEAHLSFVCSIFPRVILDEHTCTFMYVLNVELLSFR